MKTLATIIGLIDPAAAPVLRLAGTFFFAVFAVGGACIFRNRHRLFDRDPNVDNDNPAVRHMRVEVVLIPWFAVTTVLLVILIEMWSS